MSSENGKPNEFPRTRWSMVRRAGGADAELASSDLDELLRRYLPALRAYVRFGMNASAADADDLLQSFVADKIIESRLISRADPGRGKFRTFLLSTLRHYVLQRRRVDAAAKRRPRTGEPGEIHDALEFPSADPSPPQQFDVAWARQTVVEAASRMRRECERLGRADLWEIFDGRVVRPTLEGEPPIAYDQLVRRFGLDSPIRACNLLTTGKRMFARCLRDVVAEYAGVAAHCVDQEIAELRAALASGTSGRGRAESG